MSYLAGTFTGRADAVEILKDCLLVDGWNINDFYESGGENFLHADDGNKKFLNVRSYPGTGLPSPALNTVGIIGYPSTGYDVALDWLSQPNPAPAYIPGSTIYRFLPGLVLGSLGGTYWYMSSGNSGWFIFITENSEGIRDAMFFGDGDHYGLPIFSASKPGYNIAYGEDRRFFAQNDTTRTFTSAMRRYDEGNESYLTTSARFPFQSALYSEGIRSYHSSFLNASVNKMSGLPTLLPLLVRCTLSTTLNYAETIYDVAVCANPGVPNGTEVSYGGEVFKFFSLNSGAAPYTDLVWIAIKKIT